MATGNELATLRRRRGYYIAQFTRFAKKLDDIEQSGCPEEIDLIQIKDRLEIYETELRAIQNQIVAIDEGEIARGIELAEGYEKLQRRITKQLINIRRSTPSQSTSGASAAGRVSASLKLPEVRIPTFDGALEDWQSFYDSFSSTIDQNEHLAPVQKFYHLRSALTGWAARSIQSLAITESNYAIAIDVLKEKFDCHRQICMRQHELWNCHVFKAKSPKERLEIAKRASLCTNYLGKEHALTQCSAGSCRICRQRHHTYLHQDHGHSKPRTRVNRTSSSRSSSDRSSNGRSSPSSPTPRSSHRSRRTSSSPRSSPRASPRASRRASARTPPRTSPKRESRLSRTAASGSTISSSPKRQGKQ